MHCFSRHTIENHVHVTCRRYFALADDGYRHTVQLTSFSDVDAMKQTSKNDVACVAAN